MPLKYSFLVLLALSCSSALNEQQAVLKLDSLGGSTISVLPDEPIGAKNYQFIYRGTNGNVISKTCTINPNGKDSWGKEYNLGGSISGDPSVAQLAGDKFIAVTGGGKVSFAYQARGTSNFGPWKALPTTSKDIPGLIAKGRPAIGVSRINDISTVLIATAGQSDSVFVYAGSVDKLSNGTPDYFMKVEEGNRLIQDPIITCFSPVYGTRHCVVVVHTTFGGLRTLLWKDGNLGDTTPRIDRNVDQILGSTAVDYDYEIGDYTAFVVYKILGGH